MRIAGQITWGVALTLGIWLVACAAADGADFWEEREYGHAGFSFVMAQRVSDYALTGPTYGGFTGEATLGTFLGVRIGGALLFSDQQFGTGPFGVAGSPGNAWELNSVVASLGVGPQITFGVGPFRLYGYGTLGAGYVSITTASVPAPGVAPYADRINFDRWTPSAEVGGGMMIRVMGGHGRSTPVYLNVGGRYTDQNESGWIDDDGTVGLHHLRIASIRVGMSFGLHERVRVRQEETEPPDEMGTIDEK